MCNKISVKKYEYMYNYTALIKIRLILSYYVSMAHWSFFFPLFSGHYEIFI